MGPGPLEQEALNAEALLQQISVSFSVPLPPLVQSSMRLKTQPHPTKPPRPQAEPDYLIDFPPKLEAVPCKPLLFDISRNEIQFPDLSERISAKSSK